MNYEQNYKEALERARKIIKDYENRGLKDNLFYAKEDFGVIFPELKESEDEKIRKNIISFLRSKNGYMNPDEDWDFHNRWLPWLEKQGEKKPFDYENANIQQKDFAPKATTANRQVYNRAILTILSDYVEKYPDIRFGQMLCNLDIKPHFDEESREAYWNLCKTINKQNHE